MFIWRSVPVLDKGSLPRVLRFLETAEICQVCRKIQGPFKDSLARDRIETRSKNLLDVGLQIQIRLVLFDLFQENWPGLISNIWDPNKNSVCSHVYVSIYIYTYTHVYIHLHAYILV